MYCELQAPSLAALSAGASCVIPAETVMEARALQRPGDLLGGERFCRKIAGFDLGNSPEEYTEQIVAGKRIVLTTTNGTRAIHKSMQSGLCADSISSKCGSLCAGRD